MKLQPTQVEVLDAIARGIDDLEAIAGALGVSVACVERRVVRLRSNALLTYRGAGLALTTDGTRELSAAQGWS